MTEEIDKDYIINRLLSLGYRAPTFLSYYDEPHRYYHNLDHVIYILKHMNTDDMCDDIMFLSAVFHDIIYDPKSIDGGNEKKSAALFRGLSNKILNEKTIKTVEKIILETINHTGTFDKSKQFSNYDLRILLDQDKIFEYEKNILKEYQFVDWNFYKQERIKILGHYLEWNHPLVNYIKQRKPNIAIYPGSFNPFHIGHMNILQKAEQIFDKVIVAYGTNPDKSIMNRKIPYSLNYRQVDFYCDLLTDYIDNLGYDVTVIRGLRNGHDLQYEINQARFLQDLKPDIKIINIFCDKEYEHISSSAIRALEKYDINQANRYKVL